MRGSALQKPGGPDCAAEFSVPEAPAAHAPYEGPTLRAPASTEAGFRAAGPHVALKVTREGLPNTPRARALWSCCWDPGARVPQLSCAESPEFRNGVGTVPSRWPDRPPPGPALRVRGERGRLAEGARQGNRRRGSE